jgi:hypothetical protein
MFVFHAPSAHRRRLAAAAVAVLSTAAIALIQTPALADPGSGKAYRITIENLTPDLGGGASQVLSPPLIVVHNKRIDLYTVGEPASQAVADMAEDAVGATGIAEFSGNPDVIYVDRPGGLIFPGQSASYEVMTQGNTHLLSLVTMLVSTNDGFTGVDGVRLTGQGGEFYAMAYDASSEMNDQLKAHIPGPCCGDMGRNGTDEFGVISHHPGIQMGVGELDPAMWGWNTSAPVARISFERIR